MKVIGNILWFLTFGLSLSIVYFAVGVIICVPLITIPFGKMFFRLAGFNLFPFGKDVDTNFGKKPVKSLIWLIFGIPLGLLYFVLGLAFCCTIILIPFGKQHFKMMRLSLAPFGAEFEKISKQEK